MEQEVWKDVVEFEDKFEVSSLGRIKAKKSGCFRVLQVSTHGYYRVSMYRPGSNRNYSVHRLVAIAFIPNPENKATVNHINGDKLDNRVVNLEWMTHAENDQHALTLGLKNTYRPSKRITATLF